MPGKRQFQEATPSLMPNFTFTSDSPHSLPLQITELGEAYRPPVSEENINEDEDELEGD
ncbi:hypothetical protein NC652_031217 [Populus alba x Populus x berolinensis]|nr:hypothetical protein NC652_031217 [Populus alba x Populus x berolinensis]